MDFYQDRVYFDKTANIIKYTHKYSIIFEFYFINRYKIIY